MLFSRLIAVLCQYVRDKIHLLQLRVSCQCNDIRYRKVLPKNDAKNGDSIVLSGKALCDGLKASAENRCKPISSAQILVEKSKLHYFKAVKFEAASLLPQLPMQDYQDCSIAATHLSIEARCCMACCRA